MQRFTLALTFGALVLSTSPALTQTALDSVDAQASYGIGLRNGMNIGSQNWDEFDLDAFIQGLRDGIAGEPSQVSDEDLNAALTALTERLQARAETAAAEEAEARVAENAAFLSSNGARDGITTTDSGLQYLVNEAGTGDSPSIDDTVTVHYEGRLLDGTVFDSSIARGEPATFPVNGVIQGWQEALQLMQPGAKWEVWLPSDIAYGPRGTRNIAPNSVLNFTIELISIN